MSYQRADGQLPRGLYRVNPKAGERRSLREISADLVDAGYVNEYGKPYHPQAIQRMIDGDAPYRHSGGREHGQGRAGAQGAPALCHTRWHQLPRGRLRRYFGEIAVDACGQCDLCLNPPEARDVTEAAQKALSAVHRLGGRFGRGRIVDHLLGKTKDAPAAEMKISTFGIGREFSAAGWRDLLDQLQFEGLLREDPNDGRPLITLGETDAVKAVYRRERRVAMRRLTAGAETDGRGVRASATAASVWGWKQRTPPV